MISFLSPVLQAMVPGHAIHQMMTTPAAPPPHPAVWGKETVTLTPTVLGTWYVARTTVRLANPHWTVVLKV